MNAQLLTLSRITIFSFVSRPSGWRKKAWGDRDYKTIVPCHVLIGNQEERSIWPCIIPLSENVKIDGKNRVVMRSTITNPRDELVVKESQWLW